ncbi:glutathione S-transferase theta-1 isoform X2 [Musca domestica]|uniref:Glutathione S-transferase theta-1 isoform X2 n=1 Tax=Musca domestica TaxID=7370 RepID=A0ABM3UWU0_MUSDO|nr:glutathione S-transferase theta-1 isoform X2 [Musca domestica]
MDTSLEYYFDFLSQPSRALYILLKASETKFEPKTINLLGGENIQEVPAIIDREHDQPLHLAESIAILRYLAAKNYISDEFYPCDFHQRARIDEFLSWQHNGIRTSCSLYFRFLWVQEKVFGSPASEAKVAKYRKLMEIDLESMENLWLKDSDFLTGSKLTAADVFGACEIEQIRCCGYEIKNKYPKVFAWIERVRKGLHPYFNEAHQVIYTYEKDYKSKL